MVRGHSDQAVKPEEATREMLEVESKDHLGLGPDCPAQDMSVRRINHRW